MKLNPIKFKVNRIYEIIMNSYSEHSKRNSEWSEFEGKGNRRVVGYQLTPQGDYNNHHGSGGRDVGLNILGYFYNNCLIYSRESFYNLHLSNNNIFQPFYVPVKYFEKFKEFVHKYNIEYTNLEINNNSKEYEVLSDFEQWVCVVHEEEYHESKLYDWIEEYHKDISDIDSSKWFRWE